MTPTQDKEIIDLRHRLTATKRMLITAKRAIATLPADALGVATAANGRYSWPIRDELLTDMEAIIALADCEDYE